MPDNANHAIRDGDLPIVYIAGDKGLYKFFVDSNEVAKMLGIPAEERGYMVGYGALTKRTLPIPVSIELVLLPNKPAGFTFSDPRYVIRHFKADGTIENITPPLAGVAWRGVSVNAIDPNKWIIWANDPIPSGTAAVWVTADSGATWSPVPLTIGSSLNITINFAGWSRHADDFVWVAGVGHNGSNHLPQAWYGNPFTGLIIYSMVTGATRFADIWYAGVTDTGHFMAQTRTGGFTKIHKRFIVAPTGLPVFDNTMSPNGMAPDAGFLQVPGGTAVLVANNSPFATGDKSLFFTPNFLVSEPLQWAGAFTTYIAGTADSHVYMAGGYGGIREVTNPLTDPEVAPTAVYGEGLPTDDIESDAQTRTVVAAMSIRSPNDLYFMIKSGAEEWQELSLAELVPGEWVLRKSFAIIVRGA